MHGLDNNYNLKGWKVELKPVNEENEVSDKVDSFQLIGVDYCLKIPAAKQKI